MRRFLACGGTEAEAVQRLLNWVASESVGRSPVDRGLLVAGSVAAGLHAVQQSSREWGQRMQREAAGLREELVLQQPAVAVFYESPRSFPLCKFQQGPKGVSGEYQEQNYLV